MTANTKSQNTTARSTRSEETVRADYRHLPRVQVQSNRPTLREIFLLGWQYFLPRFPNGTKERRKERAR